jgi:hypothetical protein
MVAILLLQTSKMRNYSYQCKDYINRILNNLKNEFIQSQFLDYKDADYYAQSCN